MVYEILKNEKRKCDFFGDFENKLSTNPPYFTLVSWKEIVWKWCNIFCLCSIPVLIVSSLSARGQNLAGSFNNINFHKVCEEI